MSKFERGVTSGPKLNRRQRTASEVAAAGWNSRIQDDAKLGLATLYHGQDFIPDRLDKPHLHVGITFGVAMKECREHAVDRGRPGGHFQNAAVFAPEFLCQVGERAGIS